MPAHPLDLKKMRGRFNKATAATRAARRAIESGDSTTCLTKVDEAIDELMSVKQQHSQWSENINEGVAEGRTKGE